MKHIVLTGGGTAGHVTPNIALIPRLKELGYEISYIGSYDGIEKKLIEEMNIPYYGISSGKHKGKLTVLHTSDLEAKNTLGKPETVIPIESAVELEAPATEVSVQPLSFLVYRISL